MEHDQSYQQQQQQLSPGTRSSSNRKENRRSFRSSAAQRDSVHLGERVSYTVKENAIKGVYV